MFNRHIQCCLGLIFKKIIGFVYWWGNENGPKTQNILLKNFLSQDNCYGRNHNIKIFEPYLLFPKPFQKGGSNYNTSSIDLFLLLWTLSTVILLSTFDLPLHVSQVYSSLKLAARHQSVKTDVRQVFSRTAVGLTSPLWCLLLFCSFYYFNYLFWIVFLHLCCFSVFQ